MPKYEGEDHYTYKGTSVLKNKLGILSESDLQIAEANRVAIRASNLEEHPIKGNFDLKHLQAIHKYLFQDIYTWAGKLRNVDISKGGSYFAPHIHIESAANALLKNLYNGDFAEQTAYYLGELNAIHPFREGNGRATREFINHMAYKQGYVINWANVSRDEYLQASIESFHTAEHTKFYNIISPNIIKQSPNSTNRLILN